MEIIQWCNANQGFLSAILTIIGLLLSTIAIIISIFTARMPFKKKAIISCNSWIGLNEEIGYFITITNVGNRNINIKRIGFLVNKKIIENLNTCNISRKVLVPKEETTQYFTIKEFQDILYKNNISEKMKIFGYVEDTEGKKYKKFLCKVNEISRIDN